ncbi:hypothetical protein HNQ81_001944 [Desulfoprunum benzoelyticum]|uniref:Uncharacterized protein n=1 Tax=Desulfoprunum benzoelyticum TaxID=1506996 RepID=A0A840UTY3_9BACT|nr:hypothetical protein [Desulfoprunum benzoelyticum]
MNDLHLADDLGGAACGERSSCCHGCLQ